MKMCRYISFCIIILCGSFQYLYAQPGYKVDIKKPKPYEERVLRAEKTKDGKLKQPKKFLQNLTTHYNYYFNANNKLNEVLENAKMQHKDDYSSLLSFYNYSLDDTKTQTIALDSIVYKSQTGIVQHDLRSNWTDDMYFLWGAAYYLWDKLDSAALMFQFINYAFAEKEADGYYIPVGTAKEGQKEISIASKEKTGMFGNTTKRNNAFIWQIRTFTEMGKYPAAAGLINTLKTDPFFPERLKGALEEVQAYWFYKQQHWDSAAAHLQLALDEATSKQERARWEYLIAQLYEKSDKLELAKDFYARSIPHTTDPIMDVYARLNLVRLNKGEGDNYIDQNIAELLKMAKRDRYEDYRDIIYYMAAQMEMQRNNLDAARELLLKGAKYNNGNLASRDKAFLQIADLSYQQGKYQQAAAFYDSLQVFNLKEDEMARVNERKPSLTKIVFNERVIERQDSFQKIAAMPEAERTAMLNKMVKKMRKEQGLKDVPMSTGRGADLAVNAPDLFASNSNKGEWYFYNTQSKTLGKQQFKQIWGNRPNVDNWRRSGNVAQQLVAQTGANQGMPVAGAPDQAQDNTPTIESLSANLPLTEEGMKKSNDSIRMALNNLGTIFLNEVEDYQSSIDAYEALRERFPDYEKMDEVLFNLYYAYLKLPDLAKAAQIKALLNKGFANTRYASIVNSGKDPNAKTPLSPQATKDYENVYNMFIEGNFAEAEAAKKRADSIYQTNYWQPQLLYIEAVYHIKQRDDATAKTILQTLVNQEPNGALGKKAKALIDVLSRRAQIESELANYQMQNQPEQPSQPVSQPVVSQPVVQQPVVQQPVAVTSSPTVAQVQPKANTATTTVTPPAPKKDSGVVVAPPPAEKMDSAVVKKDVTPITINKDSAVTKIPAKPVDTVAKKPVQPTVTAPPKTTAPPAPVIAGFSYDPNAQHYTMILLNKVDPVFIGEARNAFVRFNKGNTATQNLDVQLVDLDKDNKVLLIGNFSNAQAAVDYSVNVKKLAASEIVPWLRADKYAFSIISTPNLDLLKANPDWNNYKKFTDYFFPGKF
jgi:hypothetical protein